ncbi:TPA: AAA family ATPase, partial [Pseudomonas putida]|nr:AAA family ATPase [Pseudomonas putida]
MSQFNIDKFGGESLSSRAEYFEKGEHEKSDNTGSEDYYFKSEDTLLAEINGGGAKALGLGDKPLPGDYQALFQGVNPRTGESFISNKRQGEIDKKKDSVLGFSTAFNVEKSISIIYASSDRDQQKIIEKAMMEASRKTIEDAERRGVIGTRQNNGQSELESTDGKVISLHYLHFTNRNQEPHLHVHCEIPNLVLGDDGQWRTINAREMYIRQTEMAAVFDGHLAKALERDSPELYSLLSVDFDRSGLVAPCVSDEMIRNYSTRRQEIKEALREMGASGADAARGAAKRTREAKEQIDPDKLRENWKDELGGIERSEGDKTPATKLQVEQLLFKNGSVFKEHDLDRAAAQLAVLHGGPSEIPAIKSEICQQLGVIRLPQKDGQPDKFTTEEFRRLEQDIARFSNKAQAEKKQFDLSGEKKAAAISAVEAEKGFELRYEQREAFIKATDGRQLSVIEGAAGTGKSQTLAAIRVGYEADGLRVLGLAPSGAAAAELEKSAGIDSRTIHSLLIRLENENPRFREKLSERDVLVVDEAGMVDTRTMHKLLGYAEEAGCKVVLVGDSKQLEAVGSASTFSAISQQVGAARIETIARQNTQRDRDIAQNWFDGGDALQTMRDYGLVHEQSDTDPAPINKVVEDAIKSHEAGEDWKQILILADRNDSVRALNERIREHRFQSGELNREEEESVVLHSDRGVREIDLAPGDRIMLRKNEKVDGQSVYNGDRATVENIERVYSGEDEKGNITYTHKITASLDRNGEQLNFTASDYGNIEHAYAMTVHKSQGLTVNEAFYLTSEMTDRRSAYVAFTRSREACNFYADSEVKEKLGENTAKFKSKETALDADQKSKKLVMEEKRPSADEKVVTQEQPSTKEILEKSGERFVYAGEEKAPDKSAPEITVIENSEVERERAEKGGYAVGELRDKPDDTRYRPGKPYGIEVGTEKAALAADYLPDAKALAQEREQRDAHGDSPSPDNLAVDIEVAGAEIEFDDLAEVENENVQLGRYMTSDIVEELIDLTTTPAGKAEQEFFVASTAQRKAEQLREQQARVAREGGEKGAQQREQAKPQQQAA